MIIVFDTVMLRVSFYTLLYSSVVENYFHAALKFWNKEVPRRPRRARIMSTFGSTEFWRILFYEIEKPFLYPGLGLNQKLLVYEKINNS